MFDYSLQCLHHVKIAFLFIPFEHLRLEHEQILLDLFRACHKLSSDTSFREEKW